MHMHSYANFSIFSLPFSFHPRQLLPTLSMRVVPRNSVLTAPRECKLWLKFLRKTGRIEGDITIDHLQHFAECLLSMNYISVLNYLSSAVTASSARLRGVNFTRDYLCLRRRVNRYLCRIGQSPKKARPIYFSDLHNLSDLDRVRVKVFCSLGLREISLLGIRRRDVLFTKVGDRLTHLHLYVDQDKVSYKRQISRKLTNLTASERKLLMKVWPVEKADFRRIYRICGFSGHSFRRTSALVARWKYESDQNEQTLTEMRMRQGWGPTSEEPIKYSLDYLQHRLDDLIPMYLDDE